MNEMNEIKKVIEQLTLNEFKIVGKKIIIDQMYLESTDPTIFDKVTYDFYVRDLLAAYVPKCIKSCDDLTLSLTDYFNGYLPLVKDTLYVARGRSTFDNVHLNNVSCRRVYLYNYIFDGDISSNIILVGNSATLGDSILIGVGENSSATLSPSDYIGNVRMENFNKVLMAITNQSPTGSLLISNCGIVDISKYYEIYESGKVKFNNIKTLIVSDAFVRDMVVEADKVICETNKFNSRNLIKNKDFKGIYLCKKFILGDKVYTKESPKCPFPNVEFK